MSNGVPTKSKTTTTSDDGPFSMNEDGFSFRTPDGLKIDVNVKEGKISIETKSGKKIDINKDSLGGRINIGGGHIDLSIEHDDFGDMTGRFDIGGKSLVAGGSLKGKATFGPRGNLKSFGIEADENTVAQSGTF